MASMISANFFCHHCLKDTAFLPIHFAAVLANVSRQTIYRWMHRGWLHWRTIPSGRRLICLQSLIQVHQVDALLLESLVRKSAFSRGEGLAKLI
jgi:hypothetical protein